MAEIRFGNSASLISDLNQRIVAVAVERDFDGVSGRAVFAGIVHQDVQQFAEECRMRANEVRLRVPASEDNICRAIVIGPRFDLLGQPGTQAHAFEGGERSLGVRTRQKQQRFHKFAEVISPPVNRGQNALVLLDRSLAAQSDLDLSENASERSAKLMRRLDSESSLPFKRFLQPIEQTVEGPVQLANLVICD